MLTQSHCAFTSFSCSPKKVAEMYYHTIKFLVLCILWYTSSAVSNTLGKQILNEQPYPVTLTFIQFGLTSLFSFVYSYSFNNIQKLDWGVVNDVGPMAIFQIGGHVFSSLALTYITVSSSHTIKVYWSLILGTVTFIHCHCV